jgi:hypothetical protein
VEIQMQPMRIIPAADQAAESMGKLHGGIVRPTAVFRERDYLGCG